MPKNLRVRKSVGMYSYNNVTRMLIGWTWSRDMVKVKDFCMAAKAAGLFM